MTNATLITPAEAGRMMGLTPAAICRRVRTGTLKSVKRGRNVFVFRAAIEREVREFCSVCGCEITLADQELGRCTQCAFVLITDDLKKTHRSWRSMIGRCYHLTNPRYASYGGRGIKTCDHWRSFKRFLGDMGIKPEGKSLDRIDNDGDYTPENCRWATAKEQMNNTRRTIYIEHGGRRRTTSQWSEETGIPANTLSTRRRRGWRIEQWFITDLKRDAHKRKRNAANNQRTEEVRG